MEQYAHAREADTDLSVVILGVERVAGQAAKAFFTAMDSLADVHGCHGWQMQSFACEGHSGRITSHCHEIDLIRIEDYREVASGGAGWDCVEYSVKEVASVFIGEAGELHVIDRASAQRGEESPL